MPVTFTVPDKIAEHINNLSLDKPFNENLQMLLVAEYQRRLSHYNLTNRQLSRKYQMSFEEFEQQQITKKQAYTWEVESDAMTWETAIDGIRTIKRQLTEIEA